MEGLGETQLVRPAGLDAKATARQGKRRFRRAMETTSSLRALKIAAPAMPCLRDSYNPEDFRVVREIVQRYCPPTVPKPARQLMKGPFDLFEALCVYVMAVEFGWPKDDTALHIGRGRKVQDTAIRIIEEIREHRACAFIDKISQAAQEYCRGFI